jgi:hypothetical protein
MRREPPVQSRTRTLGGETILAASILLLAATLVEMATLPSPSDHTAVFWIYFVLFAISSVLFALATYLLAFGPTGGSGIVGASRLGKFALLAFGVFWLIGQAFYLVGTYFVAGPHSSAYLTTSTVLTLVALIGALVGAIVIARVRIANGAARWSLIAAVVLSAITGAVAGGSTSVPLITVMHVISSLGLIFAGVTYVLHSRHQAK